VPNASILGPIGHSVTDWERAFFRDSDPLGFIVFARNVDTPDQLRRLTSDLRDAVGRDAPILIDQEGGRVQRMREPHWREWLPPLEQAALASDTARSFYIPSRIMADELRGVGIDANCAPTCDIAGPETHPFLRNRCLGEDPITVIQNARATADGLLDGGVLPVMKHMPGHGRGTVDSHLGLPVADVALDVAADWDFAPFRGLNDLPMGMTAHIIFSAVGMSPSTQNPDMIKLIRNEIGFDGLLMSDDISMEALSGTVAERTTASISAGCDVVLHCNGDPAEMQAVTDAAGTMTDCAVARTHAALAQRKTPDDIDIAALSAELEALLA
jgi:beta-N-acetylhexosaminidase